MLGKCVGSPRDGQRAVCTHHCFLPHTVTVLASKREFIYYLKSHMNLFEILELYSNGDW